MDLSESAATCLSVFDKAKATGVPVLIMKEGHAMAMVKPFKTISGICAEKRARRQIGNSRQDRFVLRTAFGMIWMFFPSKSLAPVLLVPLSLPQKLRRNCALSYAYWK
jgi:hypothetical protein